MGQIGLPTVDKMLEGEAFNVLVADALRAAALDGEIKVA